MKKRIAATFLATFLSLACVVIAGQPPVAPALDEALFREFATNSVEAFALRPLPPGQKVGYALALASVSIRKRERTRAAAFIDIAMQTAKQNDLKKEAGCACVSAAVLANMVEDLPAELDAISKAVGLFKEAGEKDLLRQAMMYRANLQHMRGMYADSVRAYKELLALADGSHEEQIKAECLSEIAMLNYKMGKTNDVVSFAQQALTICQSNHFMSCEADCLKILGNQAGGDGRAKDAMQFYEQAAIKYKDAGDAHGQANCLYNMGVCLQGQKKYADAVSSLQEAVGAYTRSASVTGVGIANMELGRTYLLMGELSKSEASLGQAQTLLARSQDLCRQAETEGYFADLKVAQGDKQSAVAHHKVAIKLYEQAKLEDRTEREMNRLRKVQSDVASPNAAD